MKKIPQNKCYTAISFCFLIATAIGFAQETPTLEDLQAAIANPADGGAGPSVWFKNAREPNFGNAGDEWVLTSWGEMTEVRADFFGNSDGAFGMVEGAERGAAISGSGGTNFGLGDNGTVLLTFQTTDTLTGLGSVFSRGVFSRESPFEISINDDALRIALRNGETKSSPTIARLNPNTWYYMAVTWDAERTGDMVEYSVVSMDEGFLYKGSLPATIVGESGAPIIVAGRTLGDGSSPVFYGSYQNLAIYERTLSQASIDAHVDLFRTLNDFESVVADALPDSYWVGGEVYFSDWLGEFVTNEELFPQLLGTRLGDLYLQPDVDSEWEIIYAEAVATSDCETKLGWLMAKMDSLPYYYSGRHEGYIYISNHDSDYLWVYDYATEDWYAYGCEQ